MHPQNTLRFCATRSLTTSIQRHISSVQIFDHVTTHLTDPLQMLAIEGRTSQTAIEEQEALELDMAAASKSLSTISISERQPLTPELTEIAVNVSLSQLKENIVINQTKVVCGRLLTQTIKQIQGDLMSCIPR